ncbi:ATP-grasp domain-containing protein [Magnetococcales bacterium HHB-1]
MTLKIAVSGINATDNPGPGLAVARSLKESDHNIQIIGLSYDLHDPGNYLDFVIDHSFILPYPNKGWESMKNKLLQIQQQVGLDAIIPNLDAELPLFIKYQNELKNLGIHTFLPSEAQFQLRTKEHLDQLADDLDILHPPTKTVTSIQQLQDALLEFNPPVMVKGNYYKAYIARNEPEAIHHFTKISEEWGFPILVQKLVSGDELNVVGVGDGEGNNLGLVAIKKLATTHLGKIWNGVTINASPLLQAAERFIQQTRWRGPFELECIVNDNKVYLIEINPRFPAWTYFATGVGINLPERVMNRSLGRACETTTDYPAGKLFVRYTYEHICDINQLSSLATTGARHG